MGAPADGLSRSAFLVLLALADQPRHGLGIIDAVDRLTQGTVTLGPGTLYGTIRKLAAGGLIRETAAAPDPNDHDPRRRYYSLTPRGRRELTAEGARLRALVKALPRTAW